jgi:hypothetical protein
MKTAVGVAYFPNDGIDKEKRELAKDAQTYPSFSLITLSAFTNPLIVIV